MRKILFLFILFIVSNTVFSQKSIDVCFVKHLSDSQSFNECIYEVGKMNLNSLSISKRDSLLYYKGWSEYSIKDLKQSAQTFLYVSDKSSFYEQSRMFAAYNYLHVSNYDTSFSILSGLSKTGLANESLINFEMAGCSLLKKDYKGFDTYIKSVDTTSYYLQKEAAQLIFFSNRMQEHREKSPFLAATLSTLVPGLGKIYSGKTGEGISSLLTVGGLGLVTWEQYRHNGLKNYKTIIAASLFSLFYIGNIYGSYFSVIVSENEFNDEYKNKILFNLHIPLRSFYK
jgi:hypothetical protein